MLISPETSETDDDLPKASDPMTLFVPFWTEEARGVSKDKVADLLAFCLKDK